MSVKPKSKMNVHSNTEYVTQSPKSRNNYGINENINEDTPKNL